MKRLALASVTLAMAGALSVGPASAQIGQPGTVGQFLEITPVKYDLTVDRNTNKVTEVSITNRHISPITLKPSFENIRADGDDGGTKPADGPVPWDLAQYTSFNPATFTLQPRETRKVPVTISIPANASPGGYYGRLRFTPTQRTDLPPVAIQGDIAELFLVRVPGQANEQGNIQDFQLNRDDGSKASGFLFGKSGYFLTRVHNGGNVHFSTSPHVVVKNKFGGTAFDSQVQAQNVFPMGDRRFESRWNNISTGMYKATVTTAVPGQPESTRQISFVVITPRVAAAAAVILVVLIALGVRQRRRRKPTGSSVTKR